MARPFSISLVIPCFNEEESLHALHQAILDVFKDSENFEMILVDDGSTDDTVQMVKALRATDPRVKLLSFSRNFGHQFAMKAGIDHASGDCIITMDADLQHPPTLIPEMISKWHEGFKVVYTKRNDSSEYPLAKKISANSFYKTISWISDVKIEEGVADFRLIDKEVAELIRPVNDNFLFLRGLLPWLGFPSTTISFDMQSRYAGKTKYTLKKMMRLALNGITSFSIKPLRLSTITGMTISFLSFLYAMYAIYARFFNNDVVEGWTSVLVAVLFIGGIQLIVLGIIGEYLGNLFVQSKGRPQYIIKEKAL